MAEEARGLLGTVDILVNNAGIAPSNPVKRLTLDEWNRVQSVNVTGTFLCTREFLQGMLDPEQHIAPAMAVSKSPALRRVKRQPGFPHGQALPVPSPEQ